MHWRTADGDDILCKHGHGWQASSRRPTTMVVAAAIDNDSNDGGEQRWRCVDSGSGGDGEAGKLVVVVDLPVRRERRHDGSWWEIKH